MIEDESIVMISCILQLFIDNVLYFAYVNKNMLKDSKINIQTFFRKE